MVTPAEKNSNDTTVSDVEIVKVIAIKLPFDLQERILSFPILHALRDLYREAEFHFITPKKNIEVLNLLPFTAYYHEFDEDEVNSIFEVHRFTANVKIFNVDLFVCLTNSFVDGCIGVGLRAKKRLGFSDGWKTLLFNQKINRPVGQHLVEDFLSLYKTHVKENVDLRLRVVSRDLAPIINDWDSLPYIAINLSPLRSIEIDEEWINLVSLFENQRIVFFSSDDQDKAILVLDKFISKLPPKNTYLKFIYPSWIELGRMLAYSQGVITYNGSIASLSSYVGTRALILYDREDPQKYGPFYFLGDVSVMGSNNPNFVHKQDSSRTIKERVVFNMDEVFSLAMSFFRLK